MRWIYLSPHLDDAVFSAGGLIFDQTHSGIPVEIWTFMCGYPSEGDLSPYAQLLHAQWGFSSAKETTRMRREEDKRAAAIVGAETLHFDFLDCIYRRDANGEWLYWDVEMPPQPADAALPFQIAAEISARLEPDDLVVCQLAVGSHVDHVLIRQAAELLKRSIVYDIDVPYIFYKQGDLEPKSAGMGESVYPITEAGLKRWQEAVAEYKSQFAGLGEAFNTLEKAQASIQAYWTERGGIRVLSRGAGRR